MIAKRPYIQLPRPAGAIFIPPASSPTRITPLCSSTCTPADRRQFKSFGAPAAPPCPKFEPLPKRFSSRDDSKALPYNGRLFINRMKEISVWPNNPHNHPNR